ncbi:MAG: LuxR C-terminal-related transcriptional regulator [Solirubrobacteraceae bacterium]
MRGQTLSDTRLLLDLVGEAYGFEDLADFRSGILELLTRVVSCDRIAYNEITPEESFVIVVPDFDPSLLSEFSALIYQNPLIQRLERTRDGRPYRISDVIDQDTFHSLELYQRVYKLVGIEWQVAFTLPARAPLIVGIALTREHHDFTAREVQLLTLVRPHLVQAYRNAELWSARKATLAALEHGLDTLGQHVVVLDRHGRLEFATDGARRLLGDGAGSRRAVPQQIGEWLAAREEPRPAAEPLILEIAGNQVLVRLLPGRSDDKRAVLLLESGTGELTVAALRSLGLTQREAETLRLTALGGSAAETATQLRIATRTVEKHLQNVYSKLGVRTRADAAATAWAAVGVRAPRRAELDRGEGHGLLAAT